MCLDTNMDTFQTHSMVGMFINGTVHPSHWFRFSSRQATGIVLILVSQVLATKKHKSGTNTCKLNEDGTITDFKWAMYLMTATAAFTALVFIVFFKPTYQRLAEEQRMAAERILNSQDDSLQIPS